MSQVAMQLDELRDVVGEVDTLAALAPEPYDHEDRKALTDSSSSGRPACSGRSLGRRRPRDPSPTTSSSWLYDSRAPGRTTGRQSQHPARGRKCLEVTWLAGSFQMARSLP